MKKNKNKEKIKLRDVFLSNKKLTRDVLIVAIAIIIVAFFMTDYRNSLKEKNQPLPAEKEETEMPEDPVVDTTGWQSYTNKWYGFEIKYPSGWPKPLLESATGEVKWEYRYQFRKKETGENTSYLGFDVVIYKVDKVKELFNTDEFPSFKYKMNENEICQFISGQMNESENYSAEEVYIPPDDNCHNPDFFFSLTRDDYIYNIAPVKKETLKISNNPKKDVIKNFPEFFSAISSFNLINIERPKVQPATPRRARTSAPMPVAAVKTEGSRLVCSKKNDHPGKSKKGKGRHLDMECCLDPDEYPNPNCYYDPGKYGKYLK